MEEHGTESFRKLATQLKINSYYEALDTIRKDLGLDQNVENQQEIRKYDKNRHDANVLESPDR